MNFGKNAEASSVAMNLHVTATTSLSVIKYGAMNRAYVGVVESTNDVVGITDPKTKLYSIGKPVLRCNSSYEQVNFPLVNFISEKR